MPTSTRAIPGRTHEVSRLDPGGLTGQGWAFPDGGEAMLRASIAELAPIGDPRCAWKVEHRLPDVLVIAVRAVLGEAETFEDIAPYGRCEEAWLGGFLALPNGIPSHDTFRRVFVPIDPDALER